LYGSLQVVIKEIKARLQFSIKQFIMPNSFATLDEIFAVCELNCIKSTLSRYLKRHGMPSGKAKARIVISNIKKKKRMAFCKEMLQKSPEWLANIVWSDETIVKATPNGEIFPFRHPKEQSFTLR
jgi:hypothetical protein